MRTTPYYPPAQPNTSARDGYYYNAQATSTRSRQQQPQQPQYQEDMYSDSYSQDSSSYPYNTAAPQASQLNVQPRGRQRNTTATTTTAAAASSSSAYPAQRSAHNTVPSPRPQQRMDDDFSSVVYTVQDTHTDTTAHETEFGGVLTIRTTTVTRTITERLVRSDEDEDSSDDEGVPHMQY